MDDKQPSRYVAGSAQRPLHRIVQQGLPKPVPLMILVDRQAAEDDGRNLVRHVAAHRASHVLIQDLSHADGIKAHDTR